jgi:glutathione S-transferase
MTGSRIAGVRLHWHPFSIIPRRVRIALREKKIPCEEVEVDLPAGAHRTPAFLRLNPLEYLEERFPEPALLPRDAGARAVCRQYMLFAGDYVNDAWKAWMAQYFGPGVSRDDPSVRAGRERLAHHLDVLEARLADHRWLVDAYSLADVCYAPVVTVLDHVGLGELVTARPAVQAWVERLNARPAVRDTAPPRPGA